jgi:endonuclease YncB( thermonuclease family)
MTWFLRLIAAACAALAIAVYGGESPAAAVRVIDGDTFDYGGERIRIADIDTPELRGKCPEEGRLARAATERLKVLLAAGPFELERLGRDEDRYGRKLRVVVRGGHSLGDTLVAEGLARTWSGRREPWC